MARPSRQQRRERRAQQPALAGAGAPPAQPPARPTAQAGGGRDGEGRVEQERQPRQSTERHGRGPFNFFRESYGELRKVEWPDQKSVISGTVVVIVACIIVGAYLFLNDKLWQYLVQHVLLR
jgi:preprotein translocase SecE subunit